MTSRVQAVRSEADAWREVQQHATAALADRMLGAAARVHLAALVRLADTMRSQLARGVHQNPPLAVFALNPPAGAVLVSKQVYAIEYKHRQDGRNYVHEFAPGAHVCASKDLSHAVIYRPDGKPVLRDF